MARFDSPKIQDNPNGWGPIPVPEKYKGMPYQPFSKGDRLGKVSDWTGSTYRDRRYANKYASMFGVQNQYAYFHAEGKSSVQLIDTAEVQKSLYQRGRFRSNQCNLVRDEQCHRQQQQQSKVLTKTAKTRERDRQRQVRKLQRQMDACQKFNQKNSVKIKNCDASVKVRPDWEVIEEMDFPVREMKMRCLRKKWKWDDV